MMHTIVARPKILVMGDPAVGKSALTQMFQTGGQRFLSTYNMTCGVDFSVKTVSVPNTEEAIELHLFDTGGQDIFAEMMPGYWEGALGVMLVYDVTRGHTLESCGAWYGRLCEALRVDGLPGVLVANKTDMRERTVVGRQQGQQMATNLNMPFFETSAKDGIDVDAPFVEMAKLMHGGGSAASP